MNKQRLEQLEQLHELCLKEVHVLQENLKVFAESSRNMCAEIKTRWPPESESWNGYALMVLDNFLTNISNILNLSRKFNLQLQLNNNHHQEGNRTDTEDTANCRNETISSVKLEGNKCLYPAEEVPDSKELDNDFVYPQINLNDTYKTESVIKAYITFVKNIDKLTFYVIDFNSEFVDGIAEVASSLDLHQYHSLPPANEVFGLVLDKKIIRAVRSTKSFYDQELEDEVWPCYLLDFGEIENMKMGDIKYKLTEKQKNIPSSAILCQLKPNHAVDKYKRKLQEMEYQQANIKIMDIKNGKLIVDFVEDNKPISKLTDNKMECSKQEKGRVETNPFKQIDTEDKTSTTELTEEQLELLYEETLCTSNAMTAVMGYNPKDEKRICRFYDPKIGSCFKGARCKKEHMPFEPEGWTKDILPAVSVVDNRYPEVIYPKGAYLNITPTYIGELNWCYAQINDIHHTNNPLIWPDEDVPVYKRLERPPHIYELVLSRYEDGFWYRAKILGHDDDYKMYKVFYVDYGNHQIVHLRNLAKCDHGMVQIPFQAIVCRFAGIKDAEISDSKKGEGITKMCETLLNKSINVKVVSHHEDLFVSLVEEEHLSLMDYLIREKYVKFEPF
ncbi:tudor domain-containing protein krimp-like [Haematobia irritans]|uniref:tudor domain-containing protein krimp-like n=1 Tax=Haematobia irritans TaxID=7368 RepID=UPI003F504BCB